MAKHKHQSEEPTIVTGGGTSTNRFSLNKKTVGIILAVVAIVFFAVLFAKWPKSGPPNIDEITKKETVNLNSQIQASEADAYVNNVSNETVPGSDTVTTANGKALPAPDSVNYDQAINLAAGLANNKADIDLAILYYKRAMEVAPATVVDMNINIGLMLENNGRAEESKSYFKAALKSVKDEQTKEWLKGKVQG